MEWTFIWYQFYWDAIIIIVRILILEKNGTLNSPQIWRTKFFLIYFSNGVKSPIWGPYCSKTITKVVAFTWHQFHSCATPGYSGFWCFILFFRPTFKLKKDWRTLQTSISFAKIIRIRILSRLNNRGWLYLSFDRFRFLKVQINSNGLIFIWILQKLSFVCDFSRIFA